MTDTKSADIGSMTGGGSAEDRLAVNHFLAGAAFLVLGGALQLLALFSLQFPFLPISYGRLEPAANLLLMVGFGVVSLAGAVYYVLPRLTGTRLVGGEIARLALIAMTGIPIVGVAAIFLGFGDGSQPWGLPWWLDIPLLGALSVPAYVTVSTVGHRKEKRSFATIWFVMGGVIWLPLLYLAHLASEVPILSSVSAAYAETFLSAGYVTMFLFTVGSGIAYYTVTKEADVALASRQLALVGFWSLGFAGAWWGAAQLIFGPGPDWVAGVAAALGLAFPLGALANAANVSLSLDKSWTGIGDKPAVVSAVLGLYMAVGVAFMAALAGFRSVASVVSLTAFWEGIEYVAISGVGLLLISSATFGALPRLSGRKLEDVNKARRFQRLTIIGSIGTLISLAAAGLMSGYSWVAGSNTQAYVDAGEGWAAGLGGAQGALMLAAVAFGLVLWAGGFLYALITAGTLARGEAIPQEVLIDAELEVDAESEDE